MADGGPRRRAARLDPDTRRGLITDAAERLLVERDPLLVTFDEVAEAASVSRALVHAYLGDRRGLVDAVQVQVIGRLDAWVGHGFHRATTPTGGLGGRWSTGTFAFVEAERDAWGVLSATGGLDHPALHGVRARWAAAMTDLREPPPRARRPGGGRRPARSASAPGSTVAWSR
jgi:AcrR family transcriptional regulator